VRETIVVGVLAFVAGEVLYPAFIGLLVRLGARQHVASYSPASHRAKEGTPTLGGALFCLIAIVAFLAVDRSRSGFLIVFALLAGAIAGGLDDVINTSDEHEAASPSAPSVRLTALLVATTAMATTTASPQPRLGAPSPGKN
jgi:phospho-N-acetylmuramoyl-pentapeptide-transferase